MRTFSTTFLTGLLLCSAECFAAEPVVAVGENAVVRGVPAIPAEVVREIGRYGNYRTASFAAWHPERLEMLVRTRFGNTTQVHRVAQPGGQRTQLTFFPEPVLDVSAWALRGEREFFTFSMDVGGDEFYQLFSLEHGSSRPQLLTDGEKRNGDGVHSETNGWLAYRRVDADADGAFTQLRVVDPANPTTDRLVATFRGGGWSPTDWSPDGQRILVLEYRSINDSRIWELDVDTGKSRRLAPADPESAPAAHGGASYAADGNGVFYTSDADTEFRRLIHDVSGNRHVLTPNLEWDVEEFDLTCDGQRLAYLVNAGGASMLHVIDVATRAAIPLPEIPVGVLGGLRWHRNGRHLAVTLSSASVPGDVFVVDVDNGELVRWTDSEANIDPSSFPEPELVRWKSFDDLTITGFLYRPPARFQGPRPVIINIHGGPEGQSRPAYLGRLNYFLNELGIAILFPNVRGSRGYGKSFLKLDNGLLRENTHRDIAALLDWMSGRDDLDARRIMVRGGSYGGYMTLSAAYRFSERIACAVDLVGISNLRTFLENTQGYRRDLRRAEYGDERVPELRQWMDATSALENVDRIRKPLLVLQGANDPRVPKSESDQIVAALEKTGTPAWYVVFNDEGHGFRKKSNADFAFYCEVQFARQFLLD